MIKFLTIIFAIYGIGLCDNVLADTIVIKSRESTEVKPKNKQQTLKLKTFKGANFDLADKRGNVVIVNFWAHWCRICKNEMLVLGRLHAAMPEITILGISIDPNSDRFAAQNTVRNIAYPNAIIGDITESSFELPSTVPITYILNSAGEVKRVIEGGFERRDIERIINDVSRL